MASDPVEELHNYMQTVTGVNQQLQSSASHLEEEEKAFDELDGQLEVHGEGFCRDVRDIDEHVTQQGEQAVQHLHSLVQHVADTWTQALQHGLQQVEHEEQEVGQFAQQAAEQLHNSFNDLREAGFEVVRAGHEELTGSVHELESSTLQAFQDLHQGVGQMLSIAGSMSSDTVHQFTSSAQHLTGHITDTVHGAFGDLKTAVEHTASEAVQTAFGVLESEFSHLFETFGGTAEEVGSHLMETGGQILHDMASYTEEHAVEAVKTEVQKAVEETIHGLLEEFAESIAMMGVGAATTTGLSPFVPELVIAKNVAKVVNEIIEAMTFGLG
jgi:hypothetical protein